MDEYCKTLRKEIDSLERDIKHQEWQLQQYEDILLSRESARISKIKSDAKLQLQKDMGILYGLRRALRIALQQKIGLLSRKVNE